jgi:Mg-chelatase subunit ChlD
MKAKIIALALFAFTAATVAFYPVFQGAGAHAKPPSGQFSHAVPVDPLATERPRLEVVFVLDTTGSMGGLIQAAKEKIWSIATTMASAQPAPEIRMGLVAYRDRGDAYVTRRVDLSEDLDSMYAALIDFQAAGGGDGPESVNQALYDAVHHMSWSQDSEVYKVVFLVGDAPPHMDYPDDVKYPATVAAALRRGILVNAIQCGQNGQTTHQWQQIAQLGNGSYFQVEQAGSALSLASPYDEKLAELSAKLDDTRLYYGSKEKREQKQRKMAAAEKLHAATSVESRARRAAYNASPSGKDNLLGEGELIDDLDSGRVDLSAIEADRLPQSMQAMAPEEQQKLIAETAGRRKELQRQIEDLSEQRAAFLRDKVEEIGGAKASLDHKIYATVREQAGKKGIHYLSDAPTY